MERDDVVNGKTFVLGNALQISTKVCEEVDCGTHCVPSCAASCLPCTTKRVLGVSAGCRQRASVTSLALRVDSHKDEFGVTG